VDLSFETTDQSINPDREEQIMSTIYEDWPDAPDFSNRLKAAFKGVEDEIRPHLKL
jgi:hypothetical protein